MRRVLTWFFCTLGVIFFVLLVGLAYLWFADPYGVRPLISALRSTPKSTLPVRQENRPGAVESPIREHVPSNDGSVSVSTTTARSPSLTEEQEAVLDAVGIDPAALPTSISPAQEECFVAALGASRVAEIKGGDTPTVLEIANARSCLDL